MPQYTLADITAISIGAMNDETADEEVTSVEGEVRDGIGEVQRTLRSPASKVCPVGAGAGAGEGAAVGVGPRRGREA